ncbi:MAG: sensor histidine kinase, partial [Oscillospiraceae bacterium]|nr:sensor histidine kinase [Oscillospiraceae bacterium]
MRFLLIIIAAAAVLTSVIVVILDRRRTKAVLGRIDSMLDEAMNGDFSESAWDESLLSSAEAKLSQYLRNSAVSAR